MTLEQLAILAYPLLYKERWASWHLYLDQNCHYQQHRPKEQQADE
jgi:hypothetical protein